MENNIDLNISDNCTNKDINKDKFSPNSTIAKPKLYHGGKDCACSAVSISRTQTGDTAHVVDLATKADFFVGIAKNIGSNYDNKSPFIEVTFKCKRKLLFTNDKHLNIQLCEVVVVECENGFDIGTVTATGEIAMEKFDTVYNSQPPANKVVRHANKVDMDKLMKNKDEEEKIINRTKNLVNTHTLDMKIIDAEWQYDHQRLTVFFTSPKRIDFRNLVKDLARIFRTRIELRQISNREEAKRIGGMGSCGRDLCCSSHTCTNCYITLDHARAQQLSTSLDKLSGYCGRLKCCLLFEYSQYTDILKHYPPVNSIIELSEGNARLTKADIFKQTFFAVIITSGVFKSFTFEEIAALNSAGKVIFPPRDEDKHDDLSQEELAELAELKCLEENF